MSQVKLVEIKKEIESVVVKLTDEELKTQIKQAEQNVCPMNNMICVAVKEEQFKRSLQA